MVFDQEKWVLRCLENMYPHVDKIYVSYSKYPWAYNPEAQKTYTNNFDLNIVKNSKYIDKIEIIEGKWNSDTDQRNAVFKKAKEEGFDYLIAQDTDEFYFYEDYEKIKSAVISNPDYTKYKINWYVFWKSFKYILINPEAKKIGGTPSVVVNLNKAKKYDNIRDIKTNNAALINNVICYHASYVLNDEEVYRKIKTWSHHKDFDVDKWYNDVWLKWTPESKNLHPIWPKTWSHTEEFNDPLPEVIADLAKENIGYIIKMRDKEYSKNGLLDLCKEFPNKATMIEIGSYAGESTKLFFESGKIKKLYAVDPWQAGYNDTDNASKSDFKLVEKTFDENVKDLNIVKFKTTFSGAFKSLPKANVIYIDGNHDYEYVLNDIHYALRKIKRGGIICGHDYHTYGGDVPKAVKEIFGRPDKIFKDTSWMKKIPNPEKYILKNRYLSKGEYDDFTQKHIDIYHWQSAEGRWKYHEKTVELLKEIPNIDNKSILEAGTMGTNICKNSDTIDLDLPNKGWPLLYSPTYNHDMAKLPWPIKDKQYDVFVALRVMHYFMKEPKKYFDEIVRICDYAILAFAEPVAEVYRSFRTPDKDIKYPEINTTVLYYDFTKNKEKFILQQNNSATIIKKGNIIYKYINYVPDSNLNKELIEREIYWLKKLEPFDIAPKIINTYDNTIVMSYCGINVTKEDLKDPGICRQLLRIFAILMENKCYYNDFDIKNTVILDGKIRLIDFSWCPMIKEDFSCDGSINSLTTKKPWGNFYNLLYIK